MAPRKRQLAGPIRPGETDAQFRARVAAVSRAVKNPTRKGKELQTIIKDPIVKGKVLALRKQYDKETVALRNVAVRIVSDFISEELVGFGKKATKAQEAKFATPAAAPDAVTDVDEFERTTGIKISQSAVLKEQGVGTFETKVKGTGTTAEPEITSLSVGKTNLPQQFEAVTQEFERLGRTGLDKDAAVDFLFSPIFNKQRETLFLQTRQKFENFLLINVTDKDKKPTQELLFAPNPLHNVKFDKSYVSKFFDIRIRRSTKAATKIDSSGKTVKDREAPRVLDRYRVSISPKPALFKSFNLKPITQKVLAAQKKAGFRVSDEFDKYISRRIADLKKSTAPEKANKILGFLLAFAEEFKEGGLTPLNIKTTVKKPEVGKITGFDLVVKGGSLKKRKPQRFISGVQLTQLVQKRMGQTMRRFGEPQAPDLTERTGRFRSSVNIIANYRKNVIMYYYNPIYDNLNKYGYRPSEQVGKATREVVQSLYARAFNIVKG